MITNAEIVIMNLKKLLGCMTEENQHEENVPNVEER
jgi:hypothetical protein